MSNTNAIPTAYTCGHSGAVPANMGRGAARQRRLSLHFNGRCLECMLVSAESEARRLTDSRATPLSGAVLDGAIAKYRQHATNTFNRRH